MTSTWRFLLLVALASSATALDANYVADQVIASINASLQAHASQWFSLPGFNITFNNRNESKWKFHFGELASVDGIESDGENGEPQIVHFGRDSSSVVIPVNMKNMVVDYKFSCQDFFEISGYTYTISRNVSTQATIIVDIIPEGPSQCRGQVHSAPASFSYEEDGSDFSKITPDDQYAKMCIVRSYTKIQDYADRINEKFEEVYGDQVEAFLSSATQFALSNLNLCRQ